MSFSKASGAAAVLAAVACAGAAAPARTQATTEERSVPVDKIFQHYDKYLKLPAADRTRWGLSYRLNAGGKVPTGVKAWHVQAGGARTPIAVGSDGRMEPLPTLAQFQAKSQVAFSAPSGTKFGVSMDIVPRVPISTRMNAVDLAAAAEQATRGTKKAAGPLGLAVPKFERVWFPGASGCAVETPQGAKPMPKTGQSATCHFDPKAWPGATAVTFEKAPARMMLGPAK